METGAKSGRFGTREECPVCTNGGASGRLCVLHDPEKESLSEEEEALFWNSIGEAIDSAVWGEVRFVGIYFPDSIGNFRLESNRFVEAMPRTISKKVMFDGCHFGSIVSISAIFEQDVWFARCSCPCTAFFFVDTIFKQKVKFLDCDFEQLSFIRVNIGNRLAIVSTGDQSKIDNITLEEVAIGGVVQVDSIKIGKLSMGRVVCDSLYMNKLTFSRGGYFTVEDTDMSHGSLSNIDLKSVHVELKRTKLVGAIFSFVDWPDELEVGREMFNQLKNAYDQNANYLEANRFYAEELDAYRKEGVPRKEKLVFYISDVVSSHGQDWIRAVGIYGLLGLFFFVPFFLPSKTAADPIGFLAFWSALIGGYFDFISPIKVTPPEECSLGWWAFYKSLSAVVLYHLVISFRRLTRR